MTLKGMSFINKIIAFRCCFFQSKCRAQPSVPGLWKTKRRKWRDTSSEDRLCYRFPDTTEICRSEGCKEPPEEPTGHCTTDDCHVIFWASGRAYLLWYWFKLQIRHPKQVRDMVQSFGEIRYLLSIHDKLTPSPLFLSCTDFPNLCKVQTS